MMEILLHGLKGIIPGCVTGFVLSAGVYIINNHIYEKQNKFLYTHCNKTRELRIRPSFEKYDISDRLKSLYKYRDIDVRNCNKMLVFVQKIMDYHDKFFLSDYAKQITISVKCENLCIAADVRMKYWLQAAQSQQKFSEALVIEQESAKLHAIFVHILNILRDELKGHQQ